MKCKAIKEFEKGLSNKHAFLKYGVLKNTFSIMSFFVDLFLKKEPKYCNWWNGDKGESFHMRGSLGMQIFIL